MQSESYLSWGRVHRFQHQIRRLEWLTFDCLKSLTDAGESFIPFGLGRSYGDVCLNSGGTLLDTSRLSRLIAFDKDTGIVRCESGLSIAELLRFSVPRGFFVPVTPGTKYVTVGGAIANDVHGKNHHEAGTFGCFVPRFELARSDGSRVICSSDENSELYRATIGGLGLTGLITWVEVRLKPIQSALIDVESIRFQSIDEFLEIENDSAPQFEYTVAWVDTLHRHGVRGLYLRGRHATGEARGDLRISQASKLLVPFDAPEVLLGPLSMRLFNEVYYRKQLRQIEAKRQSFEPFFYPLDAILSWNRLYGRRGLFQFQCVIPFDRVAMLKEIFSRIVASQNGSMLAVLKTFGDKTSPGIMSFPRPGLTLTLDFANRGERTLNLLEELDMLTHNAGGRLYPAKDSTMTPASFAMGYPEAKEFARYVDPKFSSSFWRRVK